MIRWKEDASEIDVELRDALRAISRPDPDDARALRRIALALPVAVAAAPATASAFGGVAAKAMLAAVLAGGIAAAALTRQAEKVPELAPGLVRVEVWRRPKAMRYAAPKARVVAETATLAEEAKLLLAARRSIAFDPDEARALLELHQRRYPQGRLQEERAVLEIEILKAKGKDTEALTREFSKRFPRSAHRAKLDL